MSQLEEDIEFLENLDSEREQIMNQLGRLRGRVASLVKRNSHKLSELLGEYTAFNGVDFEVYLVCFSNGKSSRWFNTDKILEAIKNKK